jgi:uncharacterized protein YciI
MSCGEDFFARCSRPERSLLAGTDQARDHMHVVLLRFSDNTSAAPQHMAGHNAWIQQGLADGVFLLVGNIQPAGGGAVLVHRISTADLEARVNADPLVAEGVVGAEIIEIAPGSVDERLSFLLP